MYMHATAAGICGCCVLKFSLALRKDMCRSLNFVRIQLVSGGGGGGGGQADLNLHDHNQTAT